MGSGLRVLNILLGPQGGICGFFPLLLQIASTEPTLSNIDCSAMGFGTREDSSGSTVPLPHLPYVLWLSTLPKLIPGGFLSLATKRILSKFP